MSEQSYILQWSSGEESFEQASAAGEAFFRIEAKERPRVIRRDASKPDQTRDRDRLIAFTVINAAEGDVAEKRTRAVTDLAGADVLVVEGYASALERAVMLQLGELGQEAGNGVSVEGKLAQDLKALQGVDAVRASRAWMQHAPDHLDAPDFLVQPEPNGQAQVAQAAGVSLPSPAIDAAAAVSLEPPALSREVMRNQKRRAYLADVTNEAVSMMGSADEVPHSEWTAIEKGYGALLSVPADALSPEEGAALAKDDLTSFRNTRNRTRAARSAIAMAWKARNQAAYRTALEEMSPDIATMLEAISPHEQAGVAPTGEVSTRGETNTVEPGAMLDKSVRAWVEKKWGLGVALPPARDRGDTVADVLDDEARSSVSDTTTADAIGSGMQFRRVTPEIERLLAPVPQNVRRRFFIGDREQYFFDRNHEKLAFVDKGLRLETQDNSPVVAESFVQIAMARGWDTIKAKGGKEFRREVWLAGELAGAKVVGYDPTPGDKELLERTLESRGVKRKDAGQRAHVELNSVEPDVQIAAGVDKRGEPPAPGAARGFAFDAEEAVIVAPDGTRFDQGDMVRMERPEKHSFKEDSPEFYRWHEYGGAARERPLDSAELGALLVGRGYSAAEADDLVTRDSHARPNDKAIWRAVSEFRQVGLSAPAPALAPQAEGEVVRTHSGTVVEHGAAPYKFEKGNPGNYYVRLEEEHGQTRDVWGKGLAEAMKVAGAGVGDTVSLKQVESEPVTVQEAVKDASGKVTHYRSKDAVLNTWLVEKAEDFKTLDPQHSLAKHPDLIGAHATMATTAAALANHFPNMSEKIREKFREQLAGKIERGEPIKAPRVVAAKALERAPESARTSARQQAEQER